MADVGDRIGWRSINEESSGVIVGQHPLGFIVQLDSGKSVVVNEKSIKE